MIQKYLIDVKKFNGKLECIEPLTPLMRVRDSERLISPLAATLTTFMELFILTLRPKLHS